MFVPMYRCKLRLATLPLRLTLLCCDIRHPTSDLNLDLRLALPYCAGTLLRGSVIASPLPLPSFLSESCSSPPVQIFAGTELASSVCLHCSCLSLLALLRYCLNGHPDDVPAPSFALLVLPSRASLAQSISALSLLTLTADRLECLAPLVSSLAHLGWIQP